MDLSETFTYSGLIGAMLVLMVNSRTGPEMNRRWTARGVILMGASGLGWAATSKPLASGAWAGLGQMWTACVVVLAIGALLWGWRRLRRDRELDAGILLDRREDPLSRIRRQRAEQQIRARVAPRSAATLSGLAGVEAAARAGRSRAMVMAVCGAVLMLAPLLSRSVRKGTIDGSPGSLVALACIVLGAGLMVLGRRHWVHHTRREQAALDAVDESDLGDRRPPRR